MATGWDEGKFANLRRRELGSSLKQPGFGAAEEPEDPASAPDPVLDRLFPFPPWESILTP